MNFKLILHRLMRTTSMLAFLSSPLAFSGDTTTVKGDDTTTAKKEKAHTYSTEDKQLLDIPEYEQATGQNKDEFNQAQKKEIDSHRDFYKEKRSDENVSIKHIDDALQVVTIVKRSGHQSTPKEFSGAHWATDKKFCSDKLELKEGETITGNGIKVGIFVNVAPHSKKDMTEKELKNFADQEGKTETRESPSFNGVALRSLATQISPKASVELHHNRELLQKNTVKPDIIQYLGYGELTKEESNNFSKNTDDKLLITAWGDTFGKSPSKGVWDLLNRASIRDKTIFVVNVQNDCQPHPSSNLPSEKIRDQDMVAMRVHLGQPEERIKETLKSLQENTLSALGTDVWYFAGTDGAKKNETEWRKRVINGKTFETGSSGNYAAALVSGAAALVMELGEEKGINLLPSEVKWILLNSARKSGATIKDFRYRDLRKAYIPDYKDSIDFKTVIILPEDEYDEKMRNSKDRQDAKSPFHQSTYQKFDPKIYGRGFLDVRRALLLTKLFCDAKKKSAFKLAEVPKEILEEFNASEKKETQAAAEKIAGALKIPAAKRLKEEKRKAKELEEEEKRKAAQQLIEDDDQALAGVDRPRSKQMNKKEAKMDARNIKKTIESEKKKSE